MKAARGKRVRCSSLVDRPVYPRLRRTMSVSKRNEKYEAGAAALYARLRRRRSSRKPVGGFLRPPAMPGSLKARGRSQR
jgi:hypothetical protein